MAAMHTATELKTILASLGIKPNRRLGQNFLVDERTRDRVIAAAGIRPDETILEIGPGLGALAEPLARHARRVVAVEKDGRLVDFLTNAFAAAPNVTITQRDIRKFDLGVFKRGTWSVVASPPYYLVAFLIRQILAAANPPRQITLVVQKEVADRLAAGAGEMNLLALTAQLVSRVTVRERVARHAFWPQPEVDSAIVTLVTHADDKRPLKRDEERLFFDFARPLFQGKRKQILGSIGRSTRTPTDQVKAILQSVGIAPETRPEAISVDKWAALFRAFTANRI